VNVELPTACVVNGKTWRLFTYEFMTPDGTFVGYFHALSIEHATYMLAELRATAKLKGEIIATDC
jgi:hypothetical protein